jgi:MinD superfamily P-loop ATPase
VGINPETGGAVKEIVIISGKGGTGKTSLAASFAALASGSMVLADCDVDAADLHLLMAPSIRKKTPFRSGHVAVIDPAACSGCARCIDLCRFGAISHRPPGVATGTVTFAVDPVACEGCGVCVRFCPASAIAFPEQACGEWYVSDTRFGPMVHAALGIAAENSGKLVTIVRTEAKKIAQERGAAYVLIDGSPGIGCPVIASITAADLALIVTEPTVSGDHDLRRIAALTRQLGVPSMVCINKWDINPDAAERIREFTVKEGIALAGLIRYDTAVTRAQRAEKTVIEYCENGIAEDVRSIWNSIQAREEKRKP